MASNFILQSPGTLLDMTVPAIEEVASGSSLSFIHSDRGFEYGASSYDAAITIPSPSFPSSYFMSTAGSRVALLDRLRASFMPRDLQQAISYAGEWAQSDDLLQGLIDIKVKFGIAGFSLFAAQKESTRLQAIKDSLGKSTEEQEVEQIDQQIERAIINESLEAFMVSHRIPIVLESLMKDFMTYDTCILYWKLQGQPRVDSGQDEHLTELINQSFDIVDVNALSPGDVEWDSELGRDYLSVTIPEKVKARIQAAISTSDSQLKARAIEALTKAGIPLAFIEAVQAGEDKIALSKEGGHRWCVITRNRKHHGMRIPSMLSIFLPLATRKMLTEGDFSTAVMMKHFILHIKSGEPAPTSHPDPRATWAKTTESDTLRDTFSGVNKTMIFASNHTVSFDFVYPPKEMFDGDKYTSCDSRIMSWAGVSGVLYNGEGSQYSGGYLSVKRLVADIAYARKMVSMAFMSMLMLPETLEHLQVGEGYKITINWNENHLKEPRQISDEVKMLLDRVLISPEAAMVAFGNNPDQMKDSIRQAMMETQTSGIWGTYFIQDDNAGMGEEGGEEGEGGANRNSAGRPANDGTTPSDSTRNQDPAPPAA
jgi:hypothetical protein